MLTAVQKKNEKKREKAHGNTDWRSSVSHNRTQTVVHNKSNVYIWGLPLEFHELYLVVWKALYKMEQGFDAGAAVASAAAVFFCKSADSIFSIFIFQWKLHTNASHWALCVAAADFIYFQSSMFC